MILVGGSAALYPLIVDWAIGLIEAKDMNAVWLAPPAILAAACARALALYGQTAATSALALRIVEDMRIRLFDHLVAADAAQIGAENSGSLLSRFTNDVTLLQESLTRAATNLIRDVLQLIALVGAMLYLDWVLTIVVLIVYPLAGAPVAQVGRKLRKGSKDFQAQMGALSGFLAEHFTGDRMVKSYRLEARQREQARDAMGRLRARMVALARQRGAVDPLMEAFGGLAIACVIGLAGWRIATGAADVGDLLGFITALLMAAQPARAIGTLSAALQQGSAAAARIYAKLDEPAQVVDAPDARPLTIARGEVRFENVRFAYPATEGHALKGLSFAASPGATTALVGASGSGKTTALNLIPRFYDVAAGRILIDGQDIRAATLDSLRGAIAVVSQDVTLFDDTIRANIAFGRLDASDAAIRAAAEAAACMDFIDALPAGLDTTVGERGARLSGGQRQRLSIARAILKDPPILLLDEATSALDAESERQVQDALAHAAAGRTTIAIAHRLSTIRAAARIYVLRDGAVVEDGDHDTLSAAGGVYAELLRLQSFAD